MYRGRGSNTDDISRADDDDVICQGMCCRNKVGFVAGHCPSMESQEGIAKPEVMRDRFMGMEYGGCDDQQQFPTANGNRCSQCQGRCVQACLASMGPHKGTFE